MKKGNTNNSNIFIFFIKNTGHNTFISIFKQEKLINVKNNNISVNIKLLKIFSCGFFGFKNRKKETPFAVSVLANKSSLYVLQKGGINIHIVFKGISVLKKIILTTIMKTKYLGKNLCVLSITDKTRNPHNGCKAKKRKKR